jgi:hypothetical protein
MQKEPRLILIYKLPSIHDGYIGVMTAPHSSVTWLISQPQDRAFIRQVAQALGVQEPELDAVLTSADKEHFGAALKRREPAIVEARQLTYPGFRLLSKCGGGYVGVVTGSPWCAKRRVRGAFRCDWIFARPISRQDVLDGMIARDQPGQDIWDLILATDENGWGYA